jgi:peptide deformylase
MFCGWRGAARLPRAGFQLRPLEEFQALEERHRFLSDQLNDLRRSRRDLEEVIEAVDERIRALAASMLETMYAESGVGLAATQVDVHERLIVMDTSDSRDQPLVLINPEIVWASDERAVVEEGCLSVPQVYDKIERHARVKVRALDRDGQPFEIDAEGLSAVCVQHEMDHLRGKVFVEYLSGLKRDRIRTKMLKRTRDEQRARA